MERYQPADYSGLSSTSHPKITGQVSAIGQVGLALYRPHFFEHSTRRTVIQGNLPLPPFEILGSSGFH
jgi:hypothetical protein